jgi:thiol-disulfide isomerase/thioredoxin
MIKKFVLLMVFVCSLIELNHAQTNNYHKERVDSRFQNYIRENIYQKVAGPLYDDELISEGDYLKITQEVKQEMQAMIDEEQKYLNESEIEIFSNLTHEVYVQLAELYLDRMADLPTLDKLGFLTSYYVKSGFLSELKSLEENLAKVLLKTYQDAFDEPFYMTPSPNVLKYFQNYDAEAQELLEAAVILHGVGFLIEDVTNYEKSADDFKNKYPNSNHLSTLSKALASVQRLKRGEQVEDFRFVRLDGSEVRLSDYKDKIIYLDLWASWCGPCIQTFKTKTPAFEEKLKAYPEVELMYVSIDDKKESWEKYLEKNPMKGIHAFSGAGFDAPIVQYFKVYGIPRYIIIGKENLLLEANAFRPGDEAFEQLLQYLK